MRWIALPYLLIFDVMSPILCLIYMLRELMDLATERVYTQQEVTSLIIILALSFATEVTIVRLINLLTSGLYREKVMPSRYMGLL